MARWKQTLGRLALSAASLAIIATLGGLLGAILGAVLDLILQALVGLPISPVVVITPTMLLGLVLSLAWGVLLVLHNPPPEPITAEQ